MTTANSLYHAANFVISCGTVTVDLHHSKVLLIRYHNPNGDTELLLPKGRKNIGETLEQAALRETEEETGYQAYLLPLPIPTRATSDEEFKDSTEPVCVVERPSGGVHKIIFWFAAHADSAAAEHEQALQEGEKFDAVWESFDGIEEEITWESDREVLVAVLTLVRVVLGRSVERKVDGELL